MIAANILLITFAIVTLAAVARSKHPVRPTTAAFLALLTGGWIWANLRDSGWQDVLNEDTPAKLDPVTKAMFWRGWPLAPVMICETYFNRLQPSGIEGVALIFNWLVLLVILSLAKFVCKTGKRGRR